MSSMSVQSILEQARALLAGDRVDEAIECLRGAASTNHPDVCAELARAFFRRGDTKGDVHSSSFFAKRAAELGNQDGDLKAIEAIGAFRKEDYAQAAGALGAFVSDASAPDSKFLGPGAVALRPTG